MLPGESVRRQGETLVTEAGQVPALVDQRLTMEAFSQLAGLLTGQRFVKVVVERLDAAGQPIPPRMHFLNHARYPFHANYIAEQILGITLAELEANLDRYNREFYHSSPRRFCLGILALQEREERFFTLETVEIDNMDAATLRDFIAIVAGQIDPTLPLLFKPGNHQQEAIVAEIPREELPRVLLHELLASASFVPLNAGEAQGRLRVFRSEADYRAARDSLAWHDIIVMARVPDDIPRLAGIINAEPTTPLSHTNVLAFGWQIPNAIQLGVFDRVAADQLDGEWVRYRVDLDGTAIALERIEAPIGEPQRPTWLVQRIRLEEPEVGRTAIADLGDLRMSDRYRYGTKAANLGELRYVLDHGSERMLGFYNVKRPPRENLRPFAAQFLELPEDAAPELVSQAAWRFLREKVKVPRGIAIPFSLQQEFLESSPAIQQGIGKLKMALELNARQIDVLCLDLQEMIRRTRLPERIRRYIDNRVAFCLSGVESFVVRSSSNAEDLENFSAAGIYESINHVTTADRIFESIREVWLSLLSPRSVRLRHEVGISLDHSYMGVILQEEVQADLGGVMVTTNPTNPQGDFRNVYINATRQSVTNVVQGSEAPIQCLFNTVEGGGRTLSLGSTQRDLTEAEKAQLQQLAFVGRLLQSHFSPDYTFRRPVDIEWLINAEGIHILQLRPYSQ